MAESTRRCCDGCGLPQRRSAVDGHAFPLRRCSQCQNAWYHDVECQKRHFRLHRTQCCPAKVQPPKRSEQQRPAAISRVETRQGRGRCLIAARGIRRGESIEPRSRGASSAACSLPIVPPVLTQAHRKCRCSVCFARLDGYVQYDGGFHCDKYPVLLCSAKCQRVGQAWLEKEERFVWELVQELPPSATILPTAVLLFRILRAILDEETGDRSSAELRPSVRSKVYDLQRPDARDQSKAEVQHQTVIVSLSQQLLRRSARHVASNADQHKSLCSISNEEFIVSLLAKVKINGFSVCDGESKSIGLGLFEGATNMNHSCRPNALQTYLYGEAGQLPLLQTTACTDICEGDEICISYIDHTPPRRVRQEALNTGYGFECQCVVCSDPSHDATAYGFRCTTPACSGMVKLLYEDGNGAKAPFHCVCDTCLLPGVSDILETVKAFESVVHSRVLGEQENLYKSFRKLCMPSSWYLKEAGERLLSDLLDASAFANSDVDRHMFCRQALSVAKELLTLYSGRQKKEVAVLRYNVLRFKASKLRLFLDPDPSRALFELQEVRKELAVFLPANHELLMDLVRCLKG